MGFFDRFIPGPGPAWPYTNLQQLNLDWIIAIVRDFLNKYSTIDEKITTGKTELTNTYNHLIELLNQWYTTHSEDISDELNEALDDLNEWYNTHSSDISNQLTQAVSDFSSQAHAIGLDVIATIPEDYTNLSTAIELENKYVRSTVNEGWIYRWQNNSFVKSNTTGLGQTAPIKVYPGAKVTLWNVTPNTDGYYITFLADNDIDTPVSIMSATPSKSIAGGSYLEFIVPDNIYYFSTAIVLSRDITILITEGISNAQNREAIMDNPHFNMFDKRMAFTGWYYFWTQNEGVTRNVASWGANSAPMEVNEGETITFYGVTPLTSNYFCVIYHDTNDINDTSGGYIVYPYKTYDDGSYYRFVVPSGVKYISFGFSASRADSIIVFRDQKPYNAKLMEVNALGDSITRGHITQSLSASPTWCEGVATKLNCIVNNYGVNASSICNSPATFLSTLNGMIETWIDSLVIFGGTNDYGDDRVVTLGTINDTPQQGTNFYASFKNLIEAALTKYPMAQILVVTPLKRRIETANAHGITLTDIANAEIEIAKYYGVPVYDMYHEGGLNPAITAQGNAYTADGLHPNQNGINLFLIPKLTEAIRKVIVGR